MLLGAGPLGCENPPWPRTTLEIRRSCSGARDIASRVGGLLRVDAEATAAELARVASRARVIHFATQALIEPEMPLLSRLLLSRSASSDGRVLVAELLGLRFRGALVTLGACRSGMSNSWRKR
ncbi:MAG: CHAT domain-containing protein [Thermoanaerobaculia bacterium]